MPSLDSILKDLENIGKNEAIERLHNLYSVIDEKKTRIKILEKLNELQDSTHFDEIENYFISDEDPKVRMEAAKVLAFNYNKKKAIQPLIWVLENEKKTDVKYTALRLLVPLADRKEFRDIIVESLQKALSSNDDRLQMEAAESLGDLKVKSAVNPLINLLKTSNKLVRIRVIQALGELNDEKAASLLIDNLRLGSYDIWKFTFDALNKILGTERLILKLLNVLKETERNNSNIDIGYLRRGIIKALGELGDDRAIFQLIDALKDWHYWVEEEAALALDKIESNWREKYRGHLKRRNINIKK